MRVECRIEYDTEEILSSAEIEDIQGEMYEMCTALERLSFRKRNDLIGCKIYVDGIKWNPKTR